MMEYDSPKPTKRNPVKERLFDWKTTIPGIIMIGAAIFVGQMDMDTTVKTSIVSPLLLAGLAALGLKSKK